MQSLGPGNATADSRPDPQSRLVSGVFAGSAALLVVFWTLLLAAIVIHTAYGPGHRGQDGERLESIWAWLVMAALAWALVNLVWSLQAVRHRFVQGFYLHFALAIGCGLIAVSIQSVMFARALTMRPQVLDYSHVGGRRGESGPPPAAAGDAFATGDAQQGKQLFATGCVTCHGPTGEGMANLAPSLIGSEFIAGADATAVASVIRNGRPVGHPQNKSGKAMPAKGGNPFLTEEQIAHLVAFIDSLRDGGKLAGGGGEGGADPAVQLSRWVVPAPAPPPAGMDEAIVAHDDRAGLPIGERFAERRRTLLGTLTLALTGVHGLFVWGVMVVAGSVVAPKLITGRPLRYRVLRPLSMAGWALAAAAWLMIAVVCFWWR